MAKNLKLQVKNTQLAQALKLGNAKKSSAKKKKEEELVSPPAEEVFTPSAVSESVEAPPEKKEPPIEKVAEGPLVQEIATPPSLPPAPELEKPKERVEPPRERRFEERRERPYPPRSFEKGRPQQERQRVDRPQPYRQERPPYRQERSGQPYRKGAPSAPRSSSPYPRRDASSPYPRRDASSPYPRRDASSPYPRRDASSPYPRRDASSPYPRRDASSPSSRPPYSGNRTAAPRPPRPSNLPRSEGPMRAAQPSRSSETRPQRKATAFKDYQDLRPQKKTMSEQSGFDSRDRMGLRSRDDEAWRKKRPSQKLKKSEMDETIRPKALHVRLPITIKDLATEMKLKSSQLISKLFMQNVIVTINDYLDDETIVQLLGQDFGCDITIDTKEEERIQITDKTIKQEIEESSPEDLILRPPVITFMGHVDHGKTSLIDAIRKTNVAAGEAGAITQHIGAFKCHSPIGDITILDTPGHEAFSAMRARGADVTDLIVLVVAGDEGIREQTVEAIMQAKAANTPIMIAINKSDKPTFNQENVYRQLAEHELLPEAWGGSVITVNCSALTGAGISDLLEMLSIQSEVLELKANPKARARGTVIESEMHKGMGSVATLLVQNGTLHKGDAIVFDLHYARVKTMHDEHGKELEEAGPSTPIKITGLSGLPEAGSEFVAVISEREAREIAHARQEQHQHKQQKEKRISLESLLEKKVESDKKKVLNLILRADVQGSLEALKQSLEKIQTDKVDLFFVSEGVGQISESDIELAVTSNSTIIGFHTKIESHAETLIKQKKPTIKLHDIIYHAVEDVRCCMRNLLDKIQQENEMGEAIVKTTFKSSQLGIIAGCQVIDGLIKRNHHARLIRDGKVIWKGYIASIKRVKEDVREVVKGLECGILLQNYSDLKEDDKIQTYEITYLEQEL